MQHLARRPEVSMEKRLANINSGLKRSWQRHRPKELVAIDTGHMAGLGKKKQSVTLEAQALAVCFTK